MKYTVVVSPACVMPGIKFKVVACVRAQVSSLTVMCRLCQQSTIPPKPSGSL